MAGIKIHVDTAAAERAASQLRKELKTLGAEAATNEKEFGKLKARLDDGMKADKAATSIDHLQKSLNLTRLETAKMQVGIKDYNGAMSTLSSGVGNVSKQMMLLGTAMSAVAIGGLALFGKGMLDTDRKSVV